MAHDDRDAVVWLVDDDERFRESAFYLLESVGLKVLGFSSGRSFLAAFDPSVTGCIVTDLRMPGFGGLSLQEEIRQQSSIPIIFLTGHGGVAAAVSAMKGGAMDFLEKVTADDALIERIQAAIEVDRDRRVKERDLEGWRERLAELSPREVEVLLLVLAGNQSKQIAHHLSVSLKTVEAHKSSVLRKVRAQSCLALSAALPERLKQELQRQV